MIEIMVASIIFLVIFFIAMEMIVRVGSVRRDDSLLAAEIDMKTCMHRFSTEYFAPGEYLFSYGWGEITATVNPYRELTEIREVNLEMTVTGGRRQTDYRILTAAEP